VKAEPRAAKAASLGPKTAAGKTKRNEIVM
jgi:hypothetical protein